MKNSFGLAQLVLRFALGLGFILPVMDRVGLMGPPGAPKVVWGDWSHFVAYTNVLVPYVNHTIAGALAFLATLGETIFGTCLIIGFKIKWMALGSALITLLFATSMIYSSGLAAPFAYPVFVFTGGGLVLSGLGTYKWSIDQYIFNKRAGK